MKEGLERIGISCFAATDNPYLWLKAPSQMKSWQFFEYLLEKTGIVGIPGSLYGSLGEGYLRLSAFCLRQNIEKAIYNL